MRKSILLLFTALLMFSCSKSDDSSVEEVEQISLSEEELYEITPPDWIQGRWIDEEQRESDLIIEFTEDDIILSQNTEDSFIDSRTEFYTTTYIDIPDFAELVNFEVSNVITEDSYRFTTLVLGSINEDYYFVKDSEDENTLTRIRTTSNGAREEVYIKLE